jgi:hypothetical protein
MGLLAYSFKPWRFGFILTKDEERMEARHKGILTRAENFWRDRERPKFVVTADKFSDGAEVYYFPHGAPPWAIDDESFTSKAYVGKLHKFEGAWHISLKEGFWEAV